MSAIRFATIPLLTALAFAPAFATEAIQQRLAQVVPSLTPDSIEPTAIDGIYEVRYGPDVFYVSRDGRYLIQGAMIDLETRENLTERAANGARAEIFAGIDDAELTVFMPVGEVRHTINIFTDPNCTFCRRLHNEMRTYQQAGVKVRYFMYPVLGRDSPEIMTSIWCGRSRTEGMDLAKAGKPVPKADCPTPMDAHLALGRDLGITGTPATITEDGLVISGYRPAIDVIRALNGQ